MPCIWGYHIIGPPLYPNLTMMVFLPGLQGKTRDMETETTLKLGGGGCIPGSKVTSRYPELKNSQKLTHYFGGSTSFMCKTKQKIKKK